MQHGFQHFRENRRLLDCSERSIKKSLMQNGFSVRSVILYK